jgi:hypothetical protein
MVAPACVGVKNVVGVEVATDCVTNELSREVGVAVNAGGGVVGVVVSAGRASKTGA